MEAAIHSSEPPEPIGLPSDLIESFLDHLLHACYAKHTLYKRRWVLSTFAQWVTDQGLALSDLDDTVVTAFADRRPGAPDDRVQLERSVIRRFLSYLRDRQLVLPIPQCKGSVSDELHASFLSHLRDSRGLAENSIQVYGPYVRQYLSSQNTGDGSLAAHAFDASTMRSYLLAHSVGKSSEVIRLIAVALRAFCRFLFLRGMITADHSSSIPTVKKWSQSTVPAFITPEQQCAILAAVDRSTHSGCRDYAVLLLLARLGLRASEVIALTLDDILWRTGEIVIHGKGRKVEHAPLLQDVGEALANYVQNARPSSPLRQVFLRTWAPHVGFTGPAAIGHIVRRAFVQVGFRPASRGAAHLFRHGLATMMIRQGASTTEIAYVLRHRSENSTAIYAKVAFDDLRTVARPWPTEGVAS